MPPLPPPSLSRLDALPDLASDVHIADAVAAYLSEPPGSRHAIAKSLARLTGGAGSLLQRVIGASPDALQLLHDLRAQCATRGAHDVECRDLDAAAARALRLVYGPALTRTQQLGLGKHEPAHILALVSAARTSETVHTYSEHSARVKFGERRMVHAMSHVAAPGELLAVLYSAFLRGIPASMAEINAASGGDSVGDVGKWELESGLIVESRTNPLTTVAFYSVGSPHSATRGLRLGTRIIYDVAGDVARRAPTITTYCTLSPIPGFLAWVRLMCTTEATESNSPLLQALTTQDIMDIAAAHAIAHDDVSTGLPKAPIPVSASLAALLRNTAWFEHVATRDLLRRPLSHLAQFYLTRVHMPGSRGAPACAVARFHLGNGASMARLCWGADTSAAGLGRSASLMVNYVYSTEGGEGLSRTMRERAAAYAESPASVLAAQLPDHVG